MTSAIEIVQASPHFHAGEWPGDVLDWINPSVMQLVTDARALSGSLIYPSPITRAHVRREWSGSRHSLCDGERLSDATDLFVSWGDVVAFLREVWSHPLRGGVGIYTDMRFQGDPPGHWAMVHVDTRPEPLDWVAWRGSVSDPLVYEYEINDPATYRRIIAERSPIQINNLGGCNE